MRRLEAGAEAAPVPLAVKATVANELGLCAALRVALPEEVACWEDIADTDRTAEAETVRVGDTVALPV